MGTDFFVFVSNLFIQRFLYKHFSYFNHIGVDDQTNRTDDLEDKFTEESRIIDGTFSLRSYMYSQGHILLDNEAPTLTLHGKDLYT